jgi:acylphosphatase
MVQGVGFRYTARSIATGFAVAGYVRNLRDGRVELVAEGEPAELDKFLAAISVAMGRYIHATEQTKSPSIEGLEGFDIRF